MIVIKISDMNLSLYIYRVVGSKNETYYTYSYIIIRVAYLLQSQMNVGQMPAVEQKVKYLYYSEINQLQMYEPCTATAGKVTLWLFL